MIIGCQDSRQNVKWRSILNIKNADFWRFVKYLAVQWS